MKEIKGTSKGRHALNGFLLDKIKSITNHNQQKISDRKAIRPRVSISPIAQLRLRSKIDWFWKQKRLNYANDGLPEQTKCVYWFYCVSV